MPAKLEGPGSKRSGKHSAFQSLSFPRCKGQGRQDDLLRPSGLVHSKSVTPNKEKKSQGVDRTLSQEPPKQHTDPRQAGDPTPIHDDLGRGAPYLSRPGMPEPWQSPGGCERRTHTGLHLRPPLAPATGSRPAGSGAAGWPARAGPLATTPPWAPALRRPGTAGPRNPRVSLSRPGASPGTPGHLREAQDSFQEHFSCVCTQAERTDTEGSVLDHRDKARITIKQTT